MGTIAELLGIDLSGAEPLDEEGAASEDGEASEAAGGTDDVPADPVGEAVTAAVLAETGLDPSDARAGLALIGPELDLDRLGRYSVITAIEHELSIQFRDADIEALETFGDLLEATRALVAAAPRRRR